MNIEPISIKGGTLICEQDILSGEGCHLKQLVLSLTRNRENHIQYTMLTFSLKKLPVFCKLKKKSALTFGLYWTYLVKNILMSVKEQ